MLNRLILSCSLAFVFLIERSNICGFSVVELMVAYLGSISGVTRANFLWFGDKNKC